MGPYKINGDVLERVFFIPITATPETIIPDDIKTIGVNAFANISSFSEIIIPPSVITIKSGAFHGCKKLKKITIPSTVEFVEDGAFADCTGLQMVTYSPKTRFSNLCFSGCSSLKFINDGEFTARTFYYPKHNQFAISLKQDQLCTREYTVYKGRFADEFFPNTRPNFNLPTVYYVEITKDGHDYVWYDTDLDMAIKGARYQASGLSPVEFFHKEWNYDTTITPNEFSLLTGICYEGVQMWLEIGQCDRDTEFPVSVVLPWFEKEIPVVYERLKYALEHQYEPVPIKYFIEGILRNQLPQ